MKQFIYGPETIGATEWPSGTLRLEGIEVTTDPSEADVFVCPGSLSLFQYDGQLLLDKLYQLPHLKGNESRTVFFDCSDNFKQAINSEIIFIRCDVRTWMLPTEPNTIQMAWPVNPKRDVDACMDIPDGGFKWDVSCHAWRSSDARQAAMRSCQEHPELKCDIVGYPDFYGYLEDTPEGIRRRHEFLRSVKESRIILSPESIAGVFPYRFFEAMAAARVPLLVSTDYVLPFFDAIPYSEFIIELPGSDAARAGEVALDYVRSHTDAQLIELGLEARYYWSKFLDTALWPKVMADAVSKQLQKRGLICA